MTNVNNYSLNPRRIPLREAAGREGIAPNARPPSVPRLRDAALRPAHRHSLKPSEDAGGSAFPAPGTSWGEDKGIDISLILRKPDAANKRLMMGPIVLPRPEVKGSSR